MRFDDATKNTATVIAVNSGAFTGAAIDVSNYSHSIITLVLDSGAGEDLTASIEDSDDGSSFAATAVPSISVGASSGLVVQTFHLDTINVRRYIRLVTAGNSPATVFGAACWLMNNAQSLATPPNVKL
jgi:hypothetical protein